MERLEAIEKQIEESKTAAKSDTLTITDNRTGKWMHFALILMDCRQNY